MEDIENGFSDFETMLPQGDLPIEHDGENDVTRVKMLAQRTLADLIEKKKNYEAEVQEAFEERLLYEREIAARGNEATSLKFQIETYEVESEELFEKLEILNDGLADLKDHNGNFPLMIYEKQYEYITTQLQGLETVSAVFAKFKSKDAIENAFNTLMIQMDQLKMKSSEEEKKLLEYQDKMEDLKQKLCSKSLINTLTAIVSALKRDLEDATGQQ